MVASTLTPAKKSEEKNYYLNPTVSKDATSSPKWQCNMCARIFPTKDETIIHLKEAHQIATESTVLMIYEIRISIWFRPEASCMSYEL